MVKIDFFDKIDDFMRFSVSKQFSEGMLLTNGRAR